MAKPISRSLAWAAQNGATCTAQRAINATQCFNPIPESFYKALEVASYRGHVHLVELLLKINGITSNPKFTPLTSACSNGHVSIVRQFQARDDIDFNCFRFCHTPLIAACSNGHKEVAKLLLDDDRVNINLGGRWMPLHKAVESGSMELVKYFLAKNDLEINIVNDQGEHVLGIALSKGYLAKYCKAPLGAGRYRS